MFVWGMWLAQKGSIIFRNTQFAPLTLMAGRAGGWTVERTHGRAGKRTGGATDGWPGRWKDVDGRTDERSQGRRDIQAERWTYGRKDRRTDWQRAELTDGRKGRRTDGRVDGQMGGYRDK